MVIVLDDDRQEPIRIRQSILCVLLGFASLGVPVMIAVSATLSDIGRLGVRTSILHIVGMIAAKPIVFLILVAVMVGPPALLMRRWCSWRVDVGDGVLTYRSLFRSRSVRTADIERVTVSRGRADLYRLFFRDGTSLAMHDVADGSLKDLARFEDEVICKTPQVAMDRRLFDKIIKRGYTEYL